MAYNSQSWSKTLLRMGTGGTLVLYPWGLLTVQGAAASFTSSLQLRDQYRKHNRSQYHPEQKYDLPPTEQCVIGWGVTDKYGQAHTCTA